MASTATTNLKMQKAEQGVTTVWGTKRNTDLDIADAAISGLIEVATTGGNTTLDNADFTLDNGKYAILRVTGATTSNATITVPTASGFSKTYVVLNETTEGGSSTTLTIKTSGHAGVAVPRSCAAKVLIRNIGGTHEVSFVAPTVVRSTGAPNSGSGAVASAVEVTPTGNLVATTAQAAFAELQGDVDTINTSLSNKQPLDSDLTAIAALANAKGNVMVGNGSAWTALGVGTDGYVPVAKAAAASGIAWSALVPAGTIVTGFQQTSAPTGWTKNTTHDNKALRVVSGSVGTGGSVAFTTAFASQTPAGTVGNTALTEAQLPAHRHLMFGDDEGSGSTVTASTQPAVFRQVAADSDYTIRQSALSATLGRTSLTGSGDAHTHTFTGTAMDLAVSYVDIISCTKDAY